MNDTEIRALCLHIASQGRDGWPPEDIAAVAEALFKYVIGETGVG